MEIRRCYYLRTKTDYVATGNAASNSWLTSSPKQYWCVRTMKPLGPDDQPVDEHLCHKGRSCFSAEGEA